MACQPIEGLAKVLVVEDVVLFGEMHGTVESPRFLASAACLALRSGRRVTVALEIPREEDARLQAYLGETAGDRAALLAGPFWQSDYQDGRRSEAMLSLIEELRRWHASGYPLRLTAIDSLEPTATGAERDQAMAKRLKAALDASPKDLLLVLTGNVHNRIGRGTPWDEHYEPMGFVLAGMAPGLRLASLDVQYSGGTAWICSGAEPSTCGIKELHGRSAAASPRVTLLGSVNADGYNGFYSVGTLTASPPAARRAGLAR